MNYIGFVIEIVVGKFVILDVVGVNVMSFDEIGEVIFGLQFGDIYEKIIYKLIKFGCIVNSNGVVDGGDKSYIVVYVFGNVGMVIVIVNNGQQFDVIICIMLLDGWQFVNVGLIVDLMENVIDVMSYIGLIFVQCVNEYLSM